MSTGHDKKGTAMVPAGAHALTRRDYPPKVAPEEFIIESARLVAFDFSGKTVYFLILNEVISPWLDSQTLAELLGYLNLKTISRNLNTVWAPYVREMYISHKAKGNNLNVVKEAVSTADTTSTLRISKMASSVLLLNERGIDLVLTLSDQPIAREFKMWLLDVQEDLKRYGSYALDGSHREGPHQLSPPQPSAPAITPAEIPDTLEKRKLDVRQIAEERRSLEARIKAAEALRDILTPLERKALILGEEAPSAPAALLAPSSQPDERPPPGWKLASQIAREHDVTPNLVGNLITQIQGRGQPMRDGVPGISVLAPVRMAGDKGWVKANHYSPEGVRLIVEEIEAWKAEKAAEDRSRKNRAQAALLDHSVKMGALGHGDEFDRLVASWRDGLGVDFVLKTHITAISAAIKKHGPGVVEQGVTQALNSDIPTNATERLRACIEAAAKAA